MGVKFHTFWWFVFVMFFSTASEKQLAAAYLFVAVCACRVFCFVFVFVCVGDMFFGGYDISQRKLCVCVFIDLKYTYCKDVKYVK